MRIKTMFSTFKSKFSALLLSALMSLSAIAPQPAVVVPVASTVATVFTSTVTTVSVTAIATVTTTAALLAPAQADAQAFSDYLENKLVDFVFRGQTLTAPATIYVGLSTTACSDSSVGTEVSGGNYARVAVTSSLANWAGTQSAGSTTASSGTGGVTSNNGVISFPMPNATWGTVTHWFLIDASSGGNPLFCAALTSSQTINSGNAVSFAAGALTVTLQ